MGRILGIDYGQKRVGIAATDPAQIIASALTTVKSNEIFDFLHHYFSKEKVDYVVLGYPLQMNNQPSEAFYYVKQFETAFKRRYPDMKLIREDERFTSVMAEKAMIAGGMKKKERQKKENTDKISAAIILQSHLKRVELNPGRKPI